MDILLENCVNVTLLNRIAVSSLHLDNTTGAVWRYVFLLLFIYIGICRHHIRPLGGILSIPEIPELLCRLQNVRQSQNLQSSE